jgi:mono/diheme cytochrome c family protein
MTDAREDETGGIMLKSLLFTALAAAVAAGIGYADQSTGKVVVPAGKTPANDGKQMYMSYCASCHGEYGKGDGPVAAALKKEPADLSVLSRNNGGKFPSAHVAAVLEFGVGNQAHGNAEMPVWGPVLSKMDPSNPNLNMKALRISNLSRYLESIQQK